MTTSQNESPLWTRVFVLSERMEEPDCTAEEIIGFLQGLGEGFAGSTDPVEQFPEFATLRLCRSFKHLLSQRITGSGSP